MKIILLEKHKAVLFHLCLWSIWLYLPLSNTPENEVYDRTILVSSFILLEHIPMFFINTEGLIPKMLHKRGATPYVWSLLLLVAVMSVWNGILLEWLTSQLSTLHPRKRNYFWNIVPPIFVAAISTGYGLFHYVVKEAQIKQEKQQERLKSELAFLRSQISPHFIFNVLNSIVYLIRSKSDLAEPVTIRLSDLMRYMLYESENTHITLDQELSYLTNYIALQKLRFEEDVEIIYRTEGTATFQMIEPMLMIPFVENAFKHGIGMIRKPVIEIDLQISDKDLHFSVKNKIAPENTSDKTSNPGIGLRNVRRRLELLYPDRHHLEIQTNQQGWFVAQLDLTFLTLPTHDA